MNRYICIFLCAIAFSACSGSGLQTGDLVFVGIPKTDAPGEYNYVHTAILEVCGDEVWVVDATLKRGVDRHPLDTFITDYTRHDGSYPLYKIMRLKDNSGAASYVENAKAFIGEQYDLEFAKGNGKHYCTELVYDSYLDEGEHLFEEYPINFRNPDGSADPYWEHFFGKLGIDIPSDGIGTMPGAMLEPDNLEPVEFDLLWRRRE